MFGCRYWQMLLAKRTRVDLAYYCYDRDGSCVFHIYGAPKHSYLSSKYNIGVFLLEGW